MGDEILTLERVTKRFGDHAAVRDLSLSVREGELFTLLGPSGCGKSTTLRMIAGLEEPDAGEISLRSEVLVAPERRIFVPTQHRNMGMVFQSFAIWPHLTVAETIAYPLRVRGVARDDVRARVARTIDLVGLDGFEDRSASELSGGQQQRVALARSLVYEPDVLLLDEPFSSLDVKLREQLRVELKLLQRRIGVTVILVTHDQIEALSLSDRIAVMSEGRAEQIGAPHELYKHPATPFVRDFLGKSNKFGGEFAGPRSNDRIAVRLRDGGTDLVGRTGTTNGFAADEPLTVCVRPEDIELRAQSENGGYNELPGIVEAVLYQGDRSECYVRAGGQEVLVLLDRGEQLRENDPVFLYFPEEAVTLWPS